MKSIVLKACWKFSQNFPGPANHYAMKIKIKGEWTLAQTRQAIFEQIQEMENQFHVFYSKDITLYIPPTNGHGDEVSCRDACGREISVLYSNGPYQSAADYYQI